MNKREFTAVYQKRGKWYIAWIEEIPGVNTQGKTKKEAEDNLREAIRMILEANRRLSKAQSGFASVLRESLHVRIPARA